MKPFTALARLVFVLVAAAHLLRFLAGVEIAFNGRMLPIWASPFVSVISAGLAWMLWREGRS